MAKAPSTSPEPQAKKRKHVEIPEEEKLAIDVNLPEPPSKKAKRLEKKKKDKKKKPEQKELPAAAVDEGRAHDNDDSESNTAAAGAPAVQKRSEHGIWIGNLPWTATKETLRQFLQNHGISGRDVVRVHMPAPSDKGGAEGRVKAQNKGFAYVDFMSADVLERALALSEELCGGRKVLIKNAKSFEGRPEKPTPPEGAGSSRTGGFGGKREPARRIFVGNLSFDATEEDLVEHFSQAGEVEDIHVATFEDSGKCKGFAWVRFRELGAAEAAVRGFVYRKADESDGDEDAGLEAEAGAGATKPKGKPRRHKQHINRLHGRPLRCEFAEDAQTRYKKRFGTGANSETVRDRREPSSRSNGAADPALTVAAGNDDEHLEDLAHQAAAARHLKGPKPSKTGTRPDADQRREERRKRHDARTVAPGKTLANAARNTGAIVAGAGKKVTFD